MITRIVELGCDHPGCREVYLPSRQELTSLRLTRIGSSATGWVRQDGKDYCPVHTRNGARAVLVDTIRVLAAKHLSDDRIARRVGLNRQAVQKLRSKHGIPSGVGPGRPPLAGHRPQQITSGAIGREAS